MTRKSPRYLIASQFDKAYLCHLQVQGSSDPSQATREALHWDPEQPYVGIQSSPILRSRGALCWDPEQPYARIQRASPSLPASMLHPDTVTSKEGSDAQSDNPCGHSPRNQKRRGTPGDHAWVWGCVTTAFLLELHSFETPAQPAREPLAGK